jgi:hypothetical protein
VKVEAKDASDAETTKAGRWTLHATEGEPGVAESIHSRPPTGGSGRATNVENPQTILRRIKSGSPSGHRQGACCSPRARSPEAPRKLKKP